MAALLRLLMNKHGQIEGGSSLYKCRAYPSGFKNCKKAKEAKMREKLQLFQETLKLLFCSGSVVQRRHFCRTCKRTEDRRTCWYRVRSR